MTQLSLRIATQYLSSLSRLKNGLHLLTITQVSQCDHEHEIMQSEWELLIEEEILVALHMLAWRKDFVVPDELVGVDIDEV